MADDDISVSRVGGLCKAAFGSDLGVIESKLCMERKTNPAPCQIRHLLWRILGRSRIVELPGLAMLPCCASCQSSVSVTKVWCSVPFKMQGNVCGIDSIFVPSAILTEFYLVMSQLTVTISPRLKC
jgi:hypothetical protein